MLNDRDSGFAPLGLGAAHGARSSLGGSGLCVIPLVANRHVADIEAVVDDLAKHLVRLGRQVLVVDAADSAPLAPELARLGVDWPAGIERLGRGVDYFPARGLPMAFRDHHGSAARFIGTAQAAAPQADTILLHAEPAEMAHLLAGALQLGFPARPVLLGTDDGHSLQTIYTAAKLLHQDTGLAQFDVLWAGGLTPARAAHMTDALSRCAQTYLGATILQWAMVKPGPELTNLLMTHFEAPPPVLPPAFAPHAAPLQGRPAARFHA
jgi:hypothetical protein